MFDAADTAVAIARVRADEALLPAEERLFADPYAGLFGAGDRSPELTERLLSVPYFRESVRLRTRFIDDTVRRALDAGIRQLVILGVGFDCRALRMTEIAATDSTVFEVDFASQLERKERTLAAAGIRLPGWVRPVACDFAAADFDARLACELGELGLRHEGGTLFVWEGVVGYLDDAAIDRSLGFMTRAGGRNTWLVLNYQTFLIDPAALAERIAAAGFVSFEVTACDALHRRLLGGEPGDMSPFFLLGLART